MILYEGPSLIDGKPIVAIITGLKSKSHNTKTGEMPQVWIIRSYIHPTEALRTGEDVSICGNCPHRPKVLGDNALKKTSRSCYVNTMSFNAVYKKYKNGGYEVADLNTLSQLLKGKKVRLGAYGEPSLIPIEILDIILANCESTGYTHRWKNCNEDYSRYLMASCDNAIDVIQATTKGYRTFYVQNIKEFDNVSRTVNGIKLAVCPASKEMGKKVQCQDCMICSGTRSGFKSNVTIMIH
jgi:hypothetical protein